VVDDKDHLIIDELTNAIDYLKKLQFFLENINIEFRWKWISICYTSAFYSMVIADLEGGNFENVLDQNWLKNRIEKKVKELEKKGIEITQVDRLKIREECLHEKNAQLINFKSAFKMFQKSEWMGKYFYGDKLHPSDEEKSGIEKIQEWRNYFVHFIPCTLGLHKLDILLPIKNSFRLFKYAFLEADPTVYWIKDEIDLNTVKEIITKIENIIDKEINNI